MIATRIFISAVPFHQIPHGKLCRFPAGDHIVYRKSNRHLNIKPAGQLHCGGQCVDSLHHHAHFFFCLFGAGAAPDQLPGPAAEPAAPAAAPAEAGPSDFFVVVFLTDGSRLEGALRLEALSVESEVLGRLSLPVSSLSRAEAGEDGAPWRMETHAGDELRVRPAADATLPLSTDFGEISVPMSAVKAIEFPKG